MGRDRERAALADVMAAVRLGAPRVVHLVGESGIGKTALVRFVSASAADQGWTVAWGRTWSADGAPPYWPWQQVLGAVFRTTTVAERCHRATLAWLVDLAPEIADLVTIPPPALDPDRARVALHRAIVHVLGAAAADRPLLVALDDLHSADADSLELAALVSRSLPNSPLLLITTQRPVGSPAAPAISTVLGELSRNAVLLPIGPLDQAAVTAQAASLSGREPTASEAAELYRASGGNPFFVEQMTRWSEHGQRLATSGLPVSPAVQQVVGERLAGLSGDANRVVTAAAVAGDEVDERVLAAVSGLPAGRFADAVQEAAVSGILWRRSLEYPVCGFVHTLLREAAAAMVAADLRRRLHHDLAVALESLPAGPVRLAEIARHRQAALPIGDPQVMVDASIAAAGWSARVFAHTATIAQCTTGLSVIGGYGTASAARRWRAQLLTVLGVAQAAAGDPTKARQTLLEAHTLALDIGDVALAAEAAAGMPSVTTFLTPDRELGSILTAALQALGDGDLHLRTRLLARRVVVTADVEDSADSADAAARRAGVAEAVRTARQLGDERLVAEVLSARLSVFWTPDTTQERLDTAAEIIALASRTGDIRRELDGRMWRLTALLEFGRVAEAMVELDRYERHAERLRQPEFLFFARSRRSTLATLDGRFDEAENLARTAYDLAVDAGLPDALDALAAQLAYIARLRGGALVDEALGLYSRLRVLPTLPATLLFAVGRATEGRALLPPALLVPPPRLVAGPVRWLFFAVIAEAADGLRDVAAARLIYDAIVPLADRFVVASGGMGCLGAASRFAGLCALTLNQLDDAVHWFRRAAAANREAGAAPLLACTQADLAVALRSRGRPEDADEARRALAEASGIAAKLRMEPLAAEIARLRATDAVPVDGLPRLNRDGEDWLLTFHGRSTRLRHSKGLTQLAVLLANPGREVSAVELAGGADTAAATPVLDEAAKLAYRRRLAELDEALALADTRGDASRAADLNAERTALVAEVKRAAGFAGRTRVFSDDAERARVNVTRTVRQALDRILAADPDAGQFLMRSVRTGIRCGYQLDR